MTSGRSPSLRWIADRRSGSPPVGTQGLRRTCLAWAASAAHEAFTPSRLSVEFLHWACGPPPGGRGTPQGLKSALVAKGQPPAQQWLYDPGIDETAVTYAPPAAVIGPYYKATIRLVDSDPESLAEQLTSGYLPIAGLRLTKAFLRAAGGIVDTLEAGTDGHAVAVVGIAETLRPVGSLPSGERLMCVRNSWGRGWGNEGHALITSRAWDASAILALVLDSLEPEAGITGCSASEQTEGAAPSA
jgi:hypothetical protein